PSRKILDKALECAESALGAKVSYSDCVSIGDRYDIDLALAVELGMGGVLVSGAEDVCNLTGILL
uniref:HAD hydrolase-like protein n=1 Tax=Treponema sp. TaxID=166 RepID=UPI00389030A7